jgi:hypothetical protein
MRFQYLILLLYSTISYSQIRWIQPVVANAEAYSIDLTEAYDHGYIILAWHGGYYPNFNWLIKSDINGNIIWEKTLGENNSVIGFQSMSANSAGCLFLTGGTTYYDNYGDVIALKLNTCGEKEWCCVFNTPGNHDYSLDIFSTRDGGCVVLMNNTGPDSNYYGERTGLAKLSPEGELIWRHDYNSPDEHSQGEILYDLLETADRGFLMTGYIYYEDPIYPGSYWSHPYYIKTDSLGIFEWETIVHKEIREIGGAAWSTILNPDSSFFYSSISHYYHFPSTSCPALLKMDLEGNVIAIYDVVQGFKDGKLSYGTFINDSTLAASAGWGNTEDSLWSRAVLIDTLGNLLSSTVLMQDLYTSILDVTYDKKLVYLSNTYQNGQFSCYLTKLNQNLESDTIYTHPFTYDSLCPYQIVSDTIVQDDCGVIVGVEEPGGGEAGRRGGMEAWEHGGLEIWPNPASGVLSVKCLGLSEVGNLELIVYDTFGKSILPPPPAGGEGRGGGQNGWTIDVSELPPGIYFIAVLQNGKRIAGGKFIVNH